MNNKAKMEQHLPFKTKRGIITGFIPDDWQVAGSIHPYKECCQDPRNWQGVGEPEKLWGPGEVHPIAGRMMPEKVDPAYYKGYRWWRHCKCGKCGNDVIATEYIP